MVCCEPLGGGGVRQLLLVEANWLTTLPTPRLIMSSLD